MIFQLLLTKRLGNNSFTFICITFPGNLISDVNVFLEMPLLTTQKNDKIFLVWAKSKSELHGPVS